ncbi:extragenic suppressor of kinetochore protein 1 [Sphaerosporella brunnea]|uniref:Extragenic suppressor of kinetochore protein 1 n=1 Tax=Sphaerosporella brunnea TaxID=1250544 RepID=A0A5J5F413_9PEZI|nr:extragenic suppressor of kinetochore protein 1 [Sphaerosporella brunnea]
MFWRFGGYANISTLDTILEKPDVTLEELLDESDLIQELKQHNTKLLEFLRDEKVLRRLLEYVIAPKPASLPPPSPKKDGQPDDEYDGDRMELEAEREKGEKARLKYSFVACEVLSSEAWSLLESLMQNTEHLRMFWGFLERSPPLDPLQASYFTKVNEVLLDKKTEEMMAFIKSLHGIVPRILKHVDCPMIMDLLLKIISMEKCEGGAGIVDWLHSQNLIPLLLSFLSNEHSQSTQTASGDFIKALITISANASQNEQSCIGPNDLTRQLVSQECIEKLIADMLKGGNPLTVGVGIIIEVIRKNNSDYDPEIGTGVESIPSSRDPIYLGTLLRLFASHVPDFMKLIMSHGLTKEGAKRELKVAFGGTIEPLGFDRFKTCELMAELLHCSNMGLLNEKGGERYVKERDRERERLKQERLQHMITDGLGDLHGSTEGVVVEKAPLQVQNGGVEMSDDAEEDFEDVLVSEMLEDVRSDVYMGFPDLPSSDITSHSKREDEEDLFVGEPLTALKEAEARDIGAPVVVAPIPADDIPRLDKTPTKIRAEEAEKSATDNKPEETKPQGDVKMEEAPALFSGAEKSEAQLSQASGESPAQQDVPKAPSPPASTGTGADDEAREGEKLLVEGLKASTDSLPQKPLEISAERLVAELPPLPEEAKTVITPPQDEEENLMDLNSTPDTTIAEGDVSIRSVGSFESSYTEYQVLVEPDLDGRPVVGDHLKMMFVEHQVVPTILDFFFRFPWNNFLHNVVYDVVQQVFNGPMDRGYNRALAIDLFVAGRITERIVEGQKYSDRFEAEKKMRLGYMGHLTLVAEEVVKFAERHPPEVLGPKVLQKVSDPVWIEYVEETLAATRERDNAILGGVRPDMHSGPRIGGMSAAQAQVFNSNSSAGQMTLGGGLDSIDLANGNGGGSSGSGREGGLLSGFGSSSDEEDDDMEHDDDEEDVTRLGLSGSSDQVGDLSDIFFDDIEDLFDDDISYL